MNETMNNIVFALIAVAEAGVVARVAMLAIKLISADEGEVGQIKKRMRNAIIFGVLALGINVFRIALANYFPWN